MREYYEPDSTVAVEGNLVASLAQSARSSPENILIRTLPGPEGTDLTAQELWESITATAKGLIAGGVSPGDRVGLMAANRYEWTLLEFAIWAVGGIVVPLYPGTTPEHLRSVADDCGLRALFVETAQAATAARAALDTEHIAGIWVIDDGAVLELTDLGVDIEDVTFAERGQHIDVNSVATITYDSSTPVASLHGCVLTHGHFLHAAAVLATEMGTIDHFAAGRGRTLMILPMANTFAQLVQILCLTNATTLSYNRRAKELFVDLEAFRPTIVLAVPRILERIFTTCSQRAAAEGHSRIFARAADISMADSAARQEGRFRPWVRAQHSLLDRPVYSKVRAALGGECALAISAGAPLGERLAHFFNGCQIGVLEAYGQSQSTGVLATNTPENIKVGTVGRPLPGTAVRVAEDGELHFRGPQVFSHYWPAEPANRHLSSDGWLKTGDLGEIDEEGFIRVTGRKREIIVTAGGKTVSPEPLEERVRAHRLVDQCLVVGDRRPYVGALITIDLDQLHEWSATRGLDSASSDISDISAHPDLVSEIQGAINIANLTVSPAESIRQFSILTASWTEEGGQLTPSLRLRRRVVAREYADEIESLYTRI